MAETEYEREMRYACYQASFLLLWGNAPPSGDEIRQCFDQGLSVGRAVNRCRREVLEAAERTLTGERPRQTIIDEVAS